MLLLQFERLEACRLAPLRAHHERATSGMEASEARMNSWLPGCLRRRGCCGLQLGLVERLHSCSLRLERVRRQDDARGRDNVARFHRPVPVIRCALLHRGAHLLCHVLCGGTVGGPLSLAIPSCLLLLDLRVLVVDCFLPVPRSTSTCARPSIPFRCGPAQCMCMCVSALCESVCMCKMQLFLSRLLSSFPET